MKTHCKPPQTTTWLTPPEIIDDLGPFDLDPCCPPVMPWRTATRMIHWPEDGLAADWGDAFVWLNPPFTRGQGRRPKGNSGGPICLVAYGELAYQRLKQSSLRGFIHLCN